MKHLALALMAVTAIAAAPPAKQTPQDVIDNAPASAWRDMAAGDLMVMTLADGGRVVVQLNPLFAPVHVANIRKMAAGGYWRGAAVYRVQDNYVAQWGINEEKRDLPAGVVARPPHEYWREGQGIRITPLPSRDAYAARVGYHQGWPVATYANGDTSLMHCYGTVGVARDLAPDTGTGGELYAIIGQAPRQLDRNIAIVGRVIEGIDRLASLPRGSEKMGFYKEGSVAAPIASVAMASDLPAADRPRFQYLDEKTATFARYIQLRANRSDDFYHVAAGGVDICNAPVPVRRVPAQG